MQKRTGDDIKKNKKENGEEVLFMEWNQISTEAEAKFGIGLLI